MTVLTLLLSGVALARDPSPECSFFEGVELRLCELELERSVLRTDRAVLGDCTEKPEGERAACETAAARLDRRIAALEKKHERHSRKMPKDAAAPAATRAVPSPDGMGGEAEESDGMEAEDDDE